jgi:glycosyltransferase involved in cell wall biosynthesis
MSDVGGMPDYAARYQHAILVPTRDEAALAAVLDDLARDAEKAARMGRAGYDSIQLTHGLPGHMDALDGLYARAIADFDKSEVAASTA